MNGTLDGETRRNLNQSHAASKVRHYALVCDSHSPLSPESSLHYKRITRAYLLVHAVRLFLTGLIKDLTRIESGIETSFNESFDLHRAVGEATSLYRKESSRKGLNFELHMANCPQVVVGDAKKIRTLIANLTANAGQFPVIVCCASVR